VVEAFHRVPREDWEELRRRSLIKKQEKMTAQHPAAATAVAALLDSRITALAS
jgi:hypothetical protein